MKAFSFNLASCFSVVLSNEYAQDNVAWVIVYFAFKTEWPVTQSACLLHAQLIICLLFSISYLR